MNYPKVIIWGYKLNKTRHTNSYIHYGFYRAFRSLGYDTLWLDNDDDVSNINFDNSIFYTEGQVDTNIPLNNTCKYILHNGNDEKYLNIKSKLYIQIFHDSISVSEKLRSEQHPTFYSNSKDLIKLNSYTCLSKNILYQPWATDLLPTEVDLNNAHNEIYNKDCVWVGTYDTGNSDYQNGSELMPFFKECIKHNLNVKIIDPWKNPISSEENKNIINKAFLAPSIQGSWQIKCGYYPTCRILKNISYGHLGITNNIALNELFDNKLVFDKNPINLFYKSMDKKNDPNIIKEIKFLMNEVKTKHTFINRIQTILSVLNNI